MYIRRKPLNVVEGFTPIVIEKAPPCSKSGYAGVYRKVDVGKIMRNTDSEQFIDEKILHLAHDENITRSGQRSFIPKINEAYTPAPIRGDPITDVYPLSRIPVKRATGRINPRIPVDVHNDSCREQDVRKFIEQRQPRACVRPTYVVPLDGPIEREVPIVRELQRTTPLTSFNSGVTTIIQTPETYEKELSKHNPQVIVDAGATSSMRCTPISDVAERERTLPVTSAGAGYTAPISFLNVDGSIDLERNGPIVGVSSGIAPIPEYSEFSPYDLDLERTLPSVSADAGVSPIYNESNISQAIMTELELERTLPQASVNVNPKSQYHTANDGRYIERPRVERENVAYTAVPNYTVRLNKFNKNPTLRPTLQPLNSGTFGAGRTIPQGIQNQTPILKARNRRLPVC